MQLAQNSLGFVVGYSESPLRSGFSLIAPQFQNVAGTKYFTINNFKPTGVDTYSNVFMTRIDEFGGAVATYGWTDCGGEDWDVADVWVDTDDNSIVTSIDFAPGEALCVQGSSVDQGLQSSGQVSTEDAVVQLRGGFSLAGNPYPVTVKLNDILPSGDELYNNVFVNIIDEFGGSIVTYGWTDCGGEDWDVADVWVNTDDNSIVDNSVVIEPGQGLWVQGSSEDQYLTFPAPEL